MKHPCSRECIKNSPSMVCRYNFKIEWYQTMSRACYDCPQNITDCYRPDCITADGISRSILAINKQMPGPGIEVNLTLFFTIRYKRLTSDKTTKQ